MFQVVCNKLACFAVLDHMIVLIIFTPLVVAHWWGTLALFDFYIYPEDVVKRAFFSLFIGWVGLMMVYCFQDFFNWINQRVHSAVWLIFNNLYIWMVCFFNICNWHGLWAFGAIIVGLAERIHHSQMMWYAIMFVTCTIILVSHNILLSLKS